MPPSNSKSESESTWAGVLETLRLTRNENQAPRPTTNLRNSSNRTDAFIERVALLNPRLTRGTADINRKPRLNDSDSSSSSSSDEALAATKKKSSKIKFCVFSLVLVLLLFTLASLTLQVDVEAVLG